jgi:hypothetical protein
MTNVDSDEESTGVFGSQPRSWTDNGILFENNRIANTLRDLAQDSNSRYGFRGSAHESDERPRAPTEVDMGIWRVRVKVRIFSYRF